MIYIYAIIILLLILIIYCFLKKPKPNTLKNIEIEKIEYLIKLLFYCGFDNGNIIINVGHNKIYQFIKYKTNGNIGLKLYLNNFGLVDEVHNRFSNFLQGQKEGYYIEENTNDIVLIDLNKDLELANNISAFILNELYEIKETKCQITIQNIDPIKKARFNLE